MVFKAGRHGEARRFIRFRFGQEQDAVFRHFRVQGRAQFFPVWDQFGQRFRIHDGARQDMRAQFAAFFQHADGHFLALFSGQLLQADRRGQACGATADDHHVILHGFARSVLFN
ncbi:hypothetical protein D3C72_1658040 [compost metagenome]